jgi:phosphoserine phosphatase
MRDLLRDLSSVGVEVWVVSASPQFVVETFAGRLGFPASRVVGIRQLRQPDGTLSYRLEGCGPAKDGADEVITYMDGKRCWVNKAIFGDASAEAMQVAPQNRPVLAAGDADTDVSFLQDAQFRVVIDRNKPELMCRARTNSDGGWMIQPMFLLPREPKGEEPACTPSSCVAFDGSRGPCE